jgi:maltose alpha-D-glucosyltransferase/alpha-amylase
MEDSPDWYKDAIFYELRIRSFYDADGDGIGDFKGLSERLDYLQDLGITTLWLLPFYPSPLRDDGYDIADYESVHPAVGTLKDFKAFLKAAHARGLKVVTELVLNHTSDQHPWFQRARRAPAGSRYRDWYVWSDDANRYSEARIIFQDFETSNWTWDPVARAYYWHRFYSHQPDLNFANPEVERVMLATVDHWLDLGVDGLRLDAVPYLFEREDTGCENLPETHGFLRKLRRHVERRFKNKMLLAEANQWPEDAVAYFGAGDECHMAFHFPIMPRLFMALRMEDSFPILDILEQTPQIPESCQWAVFLRNHDELTLEMVTDEERDYMVDAYASDRQARINLGIRRRLSPLLQNNRRRIELMNALLLSLPGTPVVYYGDEIGMGDNVYLGDRDGVRTPMQWTPDRNAGFSRANPQRLVLPVITDPEYHYEANNVETQQQNPSSLLWWMKRIIGLRKQYRAFGRGAFEPLPSSTRKVLAFLRRYEDEVLLILVNLSRFTQLVELDLSEFAGRPLLELFGNTEFPPIEERPYRFMLGSHNFYWFSLGRQLEHASLQTSVNVKTHDVRGAWEEVLSTRSAALGQALASYLPAQRWFRGKARRIKQVRVVDRVALGKAWPDHVLIFIEVAYQRGDPEIYVLPISFTEGSTDEDHAILRLRGRGSRAQSGILHDASGSPAIADALLKLVVSKRHLPGETLELVGVPRARLRELKAVAELPRGKALGVEQSNTSYVYAGVCIGKLLRCVDPGKSVELEVLEQLETLDVRPNVPALLGHIEVRFERGPGATLGLFQELVQSQGDAWQLTLDEVESFYEQALAHSHDLDPHSLAPTTLLDAAERPVAIDALMGPYLGLAAVLGRRTGELHLALGAPTENPAFSPDEYGSLAKRSFYQSLRNLASRVFDDLGASLGTLASDAQEPARELLRRKRDILARFSRVRDEELGGKRIRVHGDFHLGQVLYTGRDFVLIDFEGEPARSLSHRRSRRSPMADVAGMLRSFHYASHTPLSRELVTHVRPEDVPALLAWARVWYGWAARSFLRSYLETVQSSGLLPETTENRALLLDVFLLEKALYEVVYELNNRPAWTAIPLVGILEALDGPKRPA